MGKSLDRLMQRRADGRWQNSVSRVGAGSVAVTHLLFVLRGSPAVIGVIRVHSFLVTACLGIVGFDEFAEGRITAYL